MKTIIMVMLTASLVFAGSFGIGFSGGCEYDQDYRSMSAATLPGMYYGGEFHIQAQALPVLYLEPTFSFLNNPAMNSASVGAGLRLTVQPRLGRFPLAPFFGAEGTLLFYNSDLDLIDAYNSNRLQEYFETSHPRAVGYGFAGLSLFLGRAISLDGQYRYLGMSREIGVPMVWAGMTFYLNW